MKNELNQEIKTIWEGDAAIYDEGIKKELSDPAGQGSKWASLILSYAPGEGPQKILDCGTGPGFFPVTLGKRGHHVTGIDLTENMIKEARENIEAAGVDSQALLMDCQATEFADGSFDMVISRNITWTLSDPEKAYAEWKRVLRPGGRLLVFDGNYYLHLFDEERKKTFDYIEERLMKERGRRYFSHNGSEDTFAPVSRKLFMSDKYRPGWDLQYLIKLGFSKVYATPDLRAVPGFSETPGDELDCLIRDFMPMFLVGGEK